MSLFDNFGTIEFVVVRCPFCSKTQFFENLPNTVICSMAYLPEARAICTGMVIYEKGVNEANTRLITFLTEVP